MKSPLSPRIQLLGNFRLLLGDEPLTTVNTPRLQALLAYLVLHRAAPSLRHHLAFQLWPDSSEGQARTNLRKLFYQLQQALPDAKYFLQADTQTLGWNPQAKFTLDVTELQQHLAHLQKEPLDLTALCRVVELYQGELLPSCYDDWIVPLRQELHRAVLAALERLITLLENQRAYSAGIEFARRLLTFDPLEEKSYQRLMRLHALDGDYSGALRVYQDCVAMLQRELEVEPDAETQALYERLRRRDSTLVAKAEPKPSQSDLLPLVGRQREWQTLQNAWRQAVQGQAHFVCIWGEAGMGKTRLAEELLNWAGHQGVLTARTRSYQAQGALAYAPVTTLLRTPALSSRLGKLSNNWLSEVARLLPELLEQHPGLPPPHPMTESWQRQHFFEALARAVVADEQPLLLLFDDLHWCDHETLAWLHYLLHFAPQARLLIVGASRIEEVADAHPLTTLLLDLRREALNTDIELTPLNAAEVTALAHTLVDQELTSEQAQKLYADTEGNPLFVVETVRARQETAPGEQGSAAADAALSPPLLVSMSTVPPKIQAVIRARLTQLSPAAQKIASVAAVIGRSFSFAVLLAAAQTDEDRLIDSLDELVARRILREHGVDGYDFSHDRIREVAYQGVSRMARRLLHRRIAQAMEQIRGHHLDEVYGELAVHFEAGGMEERAVQCYLEAARVAFRLHALADVNNFCQHGLRLCNVHTVLQKDVRTEVRLLVMLAAASAAVGGYTMIEVKTLYERALTLAATIEPGEWTVSIYYGLWVFYFCTVAFAAADALTEEMPALAEQLHEPFLLELAHHGWGLTALYRGSPITALPHLVQSLALAQTRPAQSETFQQSQTLSLMSRLFQAKTLWLCGYPDQALRLIQATLQLTAEQPTPLNRAATLTVAANLHLYLRDLTTALTLAQTAIQVCNQFDLAYWRLFATIPYLCAGFGDNPDPNSAIDLFKELVAQAEARGTNAATPHNYTLLADLQWQAGLAEASITSLRHAIALAETSGEQWWLAESYRTLGELLWQRQDGDEAEACLQRALALSQQQGAKIFELRTATSLARHWQQQGQPCQAHALLLPIYSWFTEGFHTPDLGAAQALLQELSENN